MERRLVQRRVVIGCDIGKKQDPSCVVVTEQADDQFITHDLGRLALGLDYGDVARHIGGTYHRTVALLSSLNVQDAHQAGRFLHHDPSMDSDPSIKAQQSVWVLIDSGGVGEPVIDGIRERAGILEGHLTGVQITGGTSHSFRLGAKDATVSKQYLISQLKRLTGFDPPLLRLPQTDEAKALAEELAAFEFTITDSSHPQWGAQQGRHDDLIVGLALSTLPGALPIHQSGSVSYI